MFSFSQRQHSEPSQPTSECLQVARQRCLDRAHNWSIDHRELTRIGVIKKCTLTEIPTALLVTADAASTGLVRDVLTREVFIFGSTVKGCFQKIFLLTFISSRQVCLASLLKVIWLHFE
jgi:hypothetical protein